MKRYFEIALIDTSDGKQTVVQECAAEDLARDYLGAFNHEQSIIRAVIREVQVTATGDFRDHL